MGRETKLFTELNCTLEIVDVAASANGRKRENRPSLFARAENIDERVHRTEFPYWQTGNFPETGWTHRVATIYSRTVPCFVLNILSKNLDRRARNLFHVVAKTKLKLEPRNFWTLQAK